MSNFGRKQNPNSRLKGKMERDRTVDFKRMIKESKRKQYSKKNKSQNGINIDFDHEILSFIRSLFK